METTTTHSAEAAQNLSARNVNLNDAERSLSLAAGAAFVGCGLMHPSKIRGLLWAGIGAAIAYRGVTGHCRFYQLLGIDTTRNAAEEAPAGEEPETEPRTDHVSLKNQLDKDRFDKLKSTQVDRGRDEAKAIDIAAEEVKELRRRQGRSKDDDSAAEEFEKAAQKK